MKQTAQEKPQTVRETFGPWQLLIALLSAYTLVALSYEQFGRPPEDIRFLLGIFDFVVCAFFMTDFIKQLVKAKPKSAYLKYGWIDFISSIPAFPMLMWARVCSSQGAPRKQAQMRKSWDSSAAQMVGALNRYRAATS